METVISTEAAHGIIVSSAAEKSAFLPPPLANHTAHSLLPAFTFAIALAFAPAFAFAFLVVIPEGDLLLSLPVDQRTTFRPAAPSEGHSCTRAENKPGRRPTALPKAGAKPEGRSD